MNKLMFQEKYSVRRLNGFGLVDGETMERLWSYLRKFSRITKEMTPAHRIEQLSYALSHYSCRKTIGLRKSCIIFWLFYNSLK
jgi:Kyakuja-Dileera-Zisupton transposase